MNKVSQSCPGAWRLMVDSPPVTVKDSWSPAASHAFDPRQVLSRFNLLVFAFFTSLRSPRPLCSCRNSSGLVDPFVHTASCRERQRRPCVKEVKRARLLLLRPGAGPLWRDERTTGLTSASSLAPQKAGLPVIMLMLGDEWKRYWRQSGKNVQKMLLG